MTLGNEYSMNTHNFDSQFDYASNQSTNRFQPGLEVPEGVSYTRIKDPLKEDKSIWTSTSTSFPMFYYQSSKTPEKSPYKNLTETPERTPNKTSDKMEAMAQQLAKNLHLEDVDS